MIGLSRVAVRLPHSTEAVEEILVRAGSEPMERKMFAKVHGLRESPTLAEDESLEDLLVDAGRAVVGGQPVQLALYGHTQISSDLDRSDGYLDGLRSRLGLSGTRFFGLSYINCASVLRSVELARQFLARPEADPADRVLVLGGDQGSSYRDWARVTPGVTVGGDAAVGVLVHADAPERRPRYRYLGGAIGRDTRFHRGARMSLQEADLFNVVWYEETARTMLRAVEAAGLTPDQVDRVMPDLSNRMFWGKVGKRTGIPKDRFCLDLIPELGHNFGSDALIALEHADRTGRLRPGDRCLLCAVGLGAYFQAMIVEVREDS